MTDARAAFDRQMMRIALRMAMRALGTTAPNPAVGAVVADEATGEVIARGWTQPSGRPHAEKDALRRAGERARGRTMYLTLEPCANTGRLPTCSDALITSGIRRVVCAIPDPNPLISGRGFDQLRAAGIEVSVGLSAEEAHWLTLGHILRQSARRPFVQIKMALDADFRIARGTGTPTWVTGSIARNYGHILRATSDAILVGSGTVLADDPALTCRLPGLQSRSPRRIVLDGRLRVPAEAAALREPEAGHTSPATWLATRAGKQSIDARHGQRSPSALRVVSLPEGRGQIELPVLLAELAAGGVTRLLVEGGPSVWRSFLVAGLVDEAVVIVAAMPAAGDTIKVLDGPPAAALAPHGLDLVRMTPLGADTLHLLRRNPT